MNAEYLKLKQANCKDCYRCIRHCPVKAISFSDHQAHIMEDECILCGQCFVACPQNAKEIRNDIQRARQLINSGLPVYVSLAPSFVANYDGMNVEAMEKALKKLGMSGVRETALGATIVKNRYDEILNEAGRNIIISSCCHTINVLIQKHYPEILPYLAPVLSPMQAHCLSIKKEHPQAKTIFIGPCISKKAEADQYPGIVDCVLTFEELSEWLTEEKIVLEASPEEGGKGRARLFPTTGGILRSMNCANPDYAYLSIDGTENCIQAFKDILDGNLDNCFIEMSSCFGSCIGGPAMDKTHRAPVRDFIAVNSYAGADDFSVAIPPADELNKEISFVGHRQPILADGAVEEVLRKLGKTRPEDELNCGSCGYDTCREKAVAVLLGKADISMCLPFLKAKAESFSDTIITNTSNGVIVLNEALVVQQINQAACRMLNLKNPEDILGSQVVHILDPQIFKDVMNSGRDVYDKRAYLAEYQRYVQQTIIYDKNYHIVMMEMRDVTMEETTRSHKDLISRQTIEVTDQVIEKQLRVVQEIASLLGETAAETKIALTKLKESLQDE